MSPSHIGRSCPAPSTCRVSNRGFPSVRGAFYSAGGIADADLRRIGQVDRNAEGDVDGLREAFGIVGTEQAVEPLAGDGGIGDDEAAAVVAVELGDGAVEAAAGEKIGRAECRGRVCQYG